jgi:sugar phosphate isomerase/epimerase
LHVSEDLDKRLDGLKAAMNMANELGCRIVSNQIGKIPDALDTESHGTLLAALTDLAAHSLKAGAWLAIRTGPDEGSRLSELLERLPDGAFGVDFDPAELMLHGHSPVESLKPLSARVSHFRARDAVRDLSLGRGVEVQLGRGSIDLPVLLAHLEEHQYRGFITVERRDSEGDPKLECAQAIEYLANLFS